MRKRQRAAGKARKKPADLIQPDILSCNYLGVITRTLAGPGSVILRTVTEAHFSRSDRNFIFVRMNVGEEYPVPFRIKSFTEGKNSDISLELEMPPGAGKIEHLKGKAVFILSESRTNENPMLDYPAVKGFRVEDSERGLLGILTNIYESPAHPVMAISNKGKEILIPVAGNIIRYIDQ